MNDPTRERGSFSLTQSRLVEPHLEVVVPKTDGIGVDERIGPQKLRHLVQLLALAHVIDPPFRAKLFF